MPAITTWPANSNIETKAFIWKQLCRLQRAQFDKFMRGQAMPELIVSELRRRKAKA